MQADRKWVERNLGFDPISMPPPASAFAFSRAQQTSDPDDWQREIIDFDSESSAGLQFLAPIIRFDCTTKFKKEPFAQAHYASVSAKTAQFAKAQSRFGECRAIAERQHAPAKDRQSREQREE